MLVCVFVRWGVSEAPPPQPSPLEWEGAGFRVGELRADIAGVDLSGLRIDEDSICPGGTTPVVEFQFGTCE